MREIQLHLKYAAMAKTKEIQYTPDASVRYLLGFNRSDASSMTVESLIGGMPLEAAGLQPGDTITAINGTEVADGEAHMMLTFRSTRFQMSRWRLLMCVTDWIIRQRSRRRNTAHRYLDFPIIWDIRRRMGLKVLKIWYPGSEIYDPYYTSESETACYRRPRL